MATWQNLLGFLKIERLSYFFYFLEVLLYQLEQGRRARSKGKSRNEMFNVRSYLKSSAHFAKTVRRNLPCEMFLPGSLPKMLAATQTYLLQRLPHILGLSKWHR